jgi:hypothetical protein
VSLAPIEVYTRVIDEVGAQMRRFGSIDSGHCPICREEWGEVLQPVTHVFPDIGVCGKCWDRFAQSKDEREVRK